MSALRPSRGTLLGALAVLLAAAAPPDADERAEDALDALRSGVRDESYERIAEAVVELDAVVDDVSPRLRRKVVRELGDVFSDYEPRKDTTRDNRADVEDVYRMVVGALFEREGGPDRLEDALDERHVEEWPEVQMLLLEGLGYARDEERVDLFADYLEAEHPGVVTAAARALGELRDAERRVRREAVEALVEAYEDATEEVARQTRRGRDEAAARAQEFLDLTEVGFNEALASLSRRTHFTAADWRAWYDEHGRGKDW